MTALLFLLGLVPGPDLERLGADDFFAREAEHQRCDHLLFALLLPARHPDPEINHRVRAIKAQRLRWLDPRYIERSVQRASYGTWLRRYVLEGESALYSAEEVFLDLHDNYEHAKLYFELTGGGRDVPVWLRGHIVPGEYEEFRRHLDTYRGRVAPMPRALAPGTGGR